MQFTLYFSLIRVHLNFKTGYKQTRSLSLKKKKFFFSLKEFRSFFRCRQPAGNNPTVIMYHPAEIFVENVLFDIPFLCCICRFLHL